MSWRTKIVFTSDHGDTLGDHGHSQKWTMYDIVTRVPLIVWSPNRLARGQVIRALTQQMDIGATVLELAGVKIPDPFEARSLLPLLEGQTANGRQYVFAEQGRDGILRETDLVTMVRSADWKLVHFLSENFGQLFDLNHDPGEMTNLWNDQRFESVKTDLLGVLRDWLVRSNYQTREWSANWR
jgi:arylsulfatase A-like enzyme